MQETPGSLRSLVLREQISEPRPPSPLPNVRPAVPLGLQRPGSQLDFGDSLAGNSLDCALAPSSPGSLS